MSIILSDEEKAKVWEALAEAKRDGGWSVYRGVEVVRCGDVFEAERVRANHA
jgi:hypothetical protein